MTTEQATKVLDIIREYDAPRRLHSGLRSRYFVDTTAIFESKSLRESVLDCWARAIRTHGSLPRLYGIPNGGTRWAKALADYLEDAELLEMYVPGPQSTFLVDDVCTTGGSFDEYPPEPRLVVVRRRATLKHRYVTASVTAAWADITLPLEEEGS